MTPTQKALLYIKDNPQFTAKQFARYMWPNSPCWKHQTRCGGGTAIGKGMWLAAGCFLAKLRRQKLLWRTVGHSTGLTETGLAVIKDLA